MLDCGEIAAIAVYSGTIATVCAELCRQSRAVAGPPRSALPIRPGHGAVIVCNHRCPLDPSFIAMAVPRVVHWLVVREYCEHPIMGPLLRICEIIPTNRGGTDTAATKSAIRLAAAGELVAIFPEGRINISPEILLPGRPVRPWSP